MTTPQDPRPVPALRRSRTDRRVAGVCGGLAAYFALDVTLVRVLVVLLAVFGHLAGLVLYVVCWALVPEEGTDPGSAASPPAAA